MASTLRELVAARENDYGELERRYRQATGAELVADPFGSFARGPDRLTRSATVLIGAHDSVASLVPALVALEHSSFNRRCPESLEVIVVDDGSRDATRETLLGLELDLHWRYVRQAHCGLTRAHNTGLAFAQGDIIVFSDADVIHLPYALEELMKRHQLLDGITLCGFRFDVDPDEPRLDPEHLPTALREAVPAFWRDFRLAFPGWPTNMCRDTRHLRDLGGARQIRASNGAAYNLCAMVVGAFFSIAREDLLAMGASDERLVGWGCEDSLIGARSLALGNAIIPVYSAAAWHVWHPRRDRAEHDQFRNNLATVERILDEPFSPRRPDLAAWRTRALELISPPRARRPGAALPRVYPRPDALDLGRGWEAVGRFDEALAAYARDAGSAEAALGRARCLLSTGRAPAAAAAAEEALAITPDNGEAAFVLALALAASGGYPEARAVLERRRQCDPPSFEVQWALDTSTQSHKLRGNEHARQGLHRVAVVDFDLALIVDPVCVWAHFDRALSLMALHRDELALASMRRADELLHPDDANRTWLHSALATLHARLGEPTSARAQIERALALHPGNDEALTLARELR